MNTQSMIQLCWVLLDGTGMGVCLLVEYSLYGVWHGLYLWVRVENTLVKTRGENPTNERQLFNNKRAQRAHLTSVYKEFQFTDDH